MFVFEIVIALLLAGAALAHWARRLRAPYPALLALAGTLGAVVPGLPEVTLDPGARAGAVRRAGAAGRGLRRLAARPARQLGPGERAGRGLRALHHRRGRRRRALGEPGMPWAAAIALGAIVAPPDASAATAVLRQLRPPHRRAGDPRGREPAQRRHRAAGLPGRGRRGDGRGVRRLGLLPLLLLTCGGGAVLGYVLARLYLWLTCRVEELALSVAVPVPRHVRRLADRGTARRLRHHHHGGLRHTIARARRCALDARHRIASYAVWEVGGLRAERAGLHPDRAAVARDIAAAGRRRLARRGLRRARPASPSSWSGSSG